MRRKKKHPEHVNMERWLVSYADFITLLFILFLILFSMSQVDNQKFQALMQSFRSQVQGAGASLVFDNPGSAPSPTSSEDSTGLQNKSGAYPMREESEKEIEKAKEVVVTERKKFEELKEQIQDYVDQKGIQQDVELKVDSKGLYLIMTGTILFDNGKADLTSGAKRIVNDVFDILSTIDNPVRIEGHTDNNPIRTAQFPSNWELSSARAVNLLRYLIEEYKMDPSRLSAAAYGEYHPIAENNTPANRAKNRRVEIVLLSKTLDEAN